MNFESIWNITTLTFLTINYLLVTVAVINLILENRNPVKTHSFLLLLILIPFLGLIIYIFFGQNYRKNKIFSRKEVRDLNILKSLRDEQLLIFENEILIKEKALEKSSRIIKLLLKNGQAFLTDNNEINIIKNGENKYPDVLKELKNASSHIHLEYYIFSHDNIGNKITDILIDKAIKGIEVRIIYDDVGSSDISKKRIKELKKAGVEIKPFMPVIFSNLTSKINYRDHRKIIIIDGEIGYIGGLNIDDKYDNTLNNNNYWRDTHLKIRGEAIKSLQMFFMFNWYFVSKKILAYNTKYFPDCHIEACNYIQIAASGPDSDWASIKQSYFTAICTARKSIYITTPYFIPDESILTALTTSALSGIDIQIILPETPDSKIISAANNSYVNDLLEAGVKIFLYQKGFMHAKTMMIDNSFSITGSANMDYRSFNTNFEINAIIYEESITEKLKKDFEEDRENSVQINIDEWNKRSIYRRLTESLARLLAPLL